MTLNISLIRSNILSNSEVYECEIPRVILPDYKRAVYIFDEPELNEDAEFNKSCPLFVNINKNDHIFQKQISQVHWIYNNANVINERADRFLLNLAKKEMVDIINDDSNSKLRNKYSLDKDSFHKYLYGLISISIYEILHNNYVIYSLDLSYAHDDEHGLSLLFIGSSLVSSDSRFHNRGEGLLKHALYVTGSREDFDKIPL